MGFGVGDQGAGGGGSPCLTVVVVSQILEHVYDVKTWCMGHLSGQDAGTTSSAVIDDQRFEGSATYILTAACAFRQRHLGGGYSIYYPHFVGPFHSSYARIICICHDVDMLPFVVVSATIRNRQKKIRTASIQHLGPCATTRSAARCQQQQSRPRSFPSSPEELPLRRRGVRTIYWQTRGSRECDLQAWASVAAGRGGFLTGYAKEPSWAAAPR